MKPFQLKAFGTSLNVSHWWMIPLIPGLLLIMLIYRIINGAEGS